MTAKHNSLLNPIMGCLYVNFVGLHVSVIHVTIIRSVRAKEIAVQQRFPERNGIPLCFTLLNNVKHSGIALRSGNLCCMAISLALTVLMMVI